METFWVFSHSASAQRRNPHSLGILIEWKHEARDRPCPPQSQVSLGLFFWPWDSTYVLNLTNDRRWSHSAGLNRSPHQPGSIPADS